MVGDTKELFRRILDAFLNRYPFDLPELFPVENEDPG